MSEKPEQIDQIFWAAIHVANADERAAFLDKECGQDTQIRRMVEKLINAQAEVSRFLEEPFRIGDTIVQTVTVQSGTTIGPYRLLEAIGEGGMGTVYMAEQREPVRRQVAIKLIKPGMDSKQVIARFEAERQALALMDHPNIAKIHDAGTTDAGRPYFVMELVKGLPITRFCDEQKLSMNERLRLFREVCQAVQHAHQKGIIHRDLKPSNIMIAMYDDRPVPKVIDFGVAKAINEPLADGTFFTRFGQVVGTLAYMSPEQAQFNQRDIDTRSDIYSLGAILYELLVGDPPFDSERVKSQAFDETLRMIREEEPTKPSTKFSSSEHGVQAAANRATTPEKLSTSIRGDLDWIVMKSLEKDRSRRYETASSLAEDIQRCLNDEPVLACPPTASYRLRKMIRRNKAFLTTAALVFVSLIAGTGVATWQAYVASVARNQAELANEKSKQSEQKAKLEAAIAKAVTDFLQVDLLGKTSPYETPDPNVELRTILDRAATEIEGKFAGQPLVEAAIRDTISRAYYSLTKYRLAEPHQTRAVELATKTLGANAPMTLAYSSLLGTTIGHLGRYKDAERLLVQTLELQQRILGEDHADTLSSMNRLAELNWALGRFDKAETQFRQTLEMRTKTLGDVHLDTFNSTWYLASTYASQRQYDQAEQLLLKSYESGKQINGDEHVMTLYTMSSLANVYVQQDRFDEAEKLLLQTREIQERILGPEHPATLESRNGLANVYFLLGRYDKAKQIRLRLLEIHMRRFGEENQGTLACMGNLVQSYGQEKRYEESEKLSRTASKIRKRTLGEEHPDTLLGQFNLANTITDQLRFGEGEELTRQTLDACKRALGEKHPHTIRGIGNLANCINFQKRYEEAEKLFLEQLQLLEEVFGEQHSRTLECRRRLAGTYFSQRRYEDAERLLLGTLGDCKRVLGEESGETLECMRLLAMVYRRMFRYDESEKFERQVMETRKRTLGEEHPDTLDSLTDLANDCYGLLRLEEALRLQRKLLGLRTKINGETHPKTIHSHKYVGRVYGAWAWTLSNAADVNQRDPAKAVGLARKALEFDRDANNQFNLGVALFRYGQHREALATFETADEMSEGTDRQHRPFIAMAHWELGDREIALNYYRQYIAWFLAAKQSSEQHRFLDEVETLMDLSPENREEFAREYEQLKKD